ncbi:PAS domain-containing sensor histidine kinase [Alcaligenes sp. RM2]|uniref:histidine kinase n=1 Tax=Alcaligenes phenolicus TaxID=232846 RepID=A0ABV2BG83_9BURK|nr:MULTISPECIES: PAS domain-containing sensor histidine kinase [Alcaligenes]EKU30530.1 two-component sensor kinase [Alcaligenes sp. HPC1271]ERI34204.1 histidine kinase [Alcaligenes sp. EGD-AK7]MDK7585492.1 PAS domain S-box protein [Alcaligenes phenolicus]URW81192.1 PAS domain S-box protein [Alcaligenes sp. DN25]UTM01203.1 PAS domain S-box protein [Alcaligenes sp. NLF5-7]
MATHPKKSLIPSTFYDQAKQNRRGFYWLTPVVVLFLYLCVMGVFLWLQRLQNDSVMFVTIDQETRQQRLMMVILALSLVIVVSLLALWRYTRFRTHAEAAQTAETGFRRAMENSMSTGMRVFDMQGRIAYVNPAFCRMIGWNEADLVGRTAPFPYWLPGRHQQHQETLDLLLSGRTPSSGLEVEAQRRDGSRFTARMYVSPLRAPNGEQIGWMTSMTDITEPKRIREALTAAHERFMTVLEGLDDAISVVADTSEGLELLFANRTYRRFFGAQSNGHAELLGGRLGRFTDETVEIYSESAARWFEVHHRMLAWTDGRRVRLQVARDITDRRKHEEASRIQQEKVQLTSRLTTMGEMASSLAHELNQPLTAINNYSMGAVAMLKSGRYQPETLLAALEKAAQQAERAGKIISRIREFVKRSEPRRVRVKVMRIVENAVGFAEIDARKRQIEIELSIPDPVPDVIADPILIEQVLLNLLKNGIEAMEHSEHHVLQLVITQQESLLEMAVIDRGHGLKDPERLFEPFYSTKSEGLGMGLNICRTIIESHHGRLWAVGNPEGGTIFRFSLPCAAPDVTDTLDNKLEIPE